jgi:parallel beta-helix repeat protein
MTLDRVPCVVVIALAAALFGSPIGRAESARCAGDGRTDDSRCLSAYVAQHPTASLLAGATYRVTHPIIIHGRRHISGKGAVIIGDGPMASVLVLAGEDIEIDSLEIQNHSTLNKSVTIDVGARARWIRIRRCRFSGVRSVAALNINSPDVKYVVFDDNTVSEGVYGVLTNWRTAHLRHVEINRNRMSGLSGDGIEINFPVLIPPHGTGDGAAAPSDIWILANAISAPRSQSINSGFCIGIAGAHNVEIRDNTLSNCKWQGIHIEDTAADIRIIHNTITSVIGRQAGDKDGWKAYRDGILALNSRRVTVQDNTMLDIPDTGVDFAYDATSFDAGEVICGNIMKRVGRYGISVMAAAGQDVQALVGPVGSCRANTIEAGEAPLHTNRPVGLVATDPGQ